MVRGETEERIAWSEAKVEALQNRLAQALVQFHELEDSRRKTATMAVNYHRAAG